MREQIEATPALATIRIPPARAAKGCLSFGKYRLAISAAIYNF
jgi:hypothetical protein